AYGLVPALAAGRVRARDLSLGVGVTTGKALDRNVGHAVRNFDAVTGGPDHRGGGVHPLVDDDPASRSDPYPGGAGEAGGGPLLCADDSEGAPAFPRRWRPPPHRGLPPQPPN